MSVQETAQSGLKRDGRAAGFCKAKVFGAVGVEPWHHMHFTGTCSIMSVCSFHNETLPHNLLYLICDWAVEYRLHRQSGKLLFLLSPLNSYQVKYTILSSTTMWRYPGMQH